MARLALLACAVLLLAASASAYTSIALPVGGCTPDQCSGLDITNFQKFATGTFDPAVNASWVSKYKNDVGYYLTTYNRKLKKSQMNEVNQPNINFQCYADESSFVISSTDVDSLETCCNNCAAQTDCMTFQLIPDYDTDNTFLGTGKCLMRKGGTYTADGSAFPPIGGAQPELSAPAVVTCSPGQSPNSVNPTWLGGRCNPYVEGDPHFVGAHGTQFDFNGQLDKSYCLATDTRLQINAAIKGYKAVGAKKEIRSWIKEVAILWVDNAGSSHTLHLKARPGPETERADGFLRDVILDGVAVPVPSSPATAISQGDLALAFLGSGFVGPYATDKFALSVNGLLDLTFSLRTAHKLLRTAKDAEVHFNLMFNRIAVTDKVHGVLGQTYRDTQEQLAKAVKYTELSRLLHKSIEADGKSGKGFLEGKPEDYMTTTIVAPDCRFSVFDKQASQ